MSDLNIYFGNSELCRNKPNMVLYSKGKTIHKTLNFKESYVEL